MRSLPRVLCLVVLPALLLTACTDLMDALNGSGGDFSITVGGSMQPNYTWTTGAAFSVDVVRTSNETVVVWRVADPNNQNIQSPVTQGVVPSGALETASAERVLTAGVQYRVTIHLADGRSAYQDFKP